MVSKTVFKNILNCCTKRNFLFNGKVYQQTDGVQMGSPLGPTFANWFLGHVEDNIFGQIKAFFPEFYVRYVDDVFAVFEKKGDVDKFLKLLNSQHPQLKFTVETADSSLPFLDVEVAMRGQDVDTWVYRKKTDTRTILAFDSVAPASWKYGLFKCFMDRAKKICSNCTLLQREKKYLETLFKNNGYGQSWIDKMTNREKDRKNEVDDKRDFMIFKIPFLGSCSVKFGKDLAKVFDARWKTRLKIAFTNCKVGSYFVLKDKVPWIFASNVVYKFECTMDSEVTYIGMTTRQACKRFKEHFDPKKTSAIQEHVANCKPCCGSKNYFDLFKILTQCNSEKETEVTEAMLIRKYQPILNKQLGVSNGASFVINVFK